MAGFLKCYFDESNTNVVDTRDYKKTGYRDNPMIAMLTAHQENLLPVITPKVAHISALTVTEFKVRRINAKTEEVLSTITLSTALLTKKSGTVWDYFYYDGTQDLGNFDYGTHEIYIKLSDDTIIKSEFFCIVNSDFSGALGDFNIDFNNDFYNN